MEISLPVPGALSIPAYAALADVEAGPRPGVVVVHEAFGLNDDIRRITDRFAAHGYHAVAPDLLAGGNSLRCLMSLMRSARSGTGVALAQLQAARSLLTARADCTGQVGVAGFCLGGSFALLLAGRGFNVSAVQYGQLPRALDDAVRGACPIVASYGGRDRFLRGSARRLESALTHAGVEHDVKEYPEAGHSFMGHAGGPSYLRPMTDWVMHAGYVDTAAEDAWSRILAMFGSALSPPVPE